MTATLPPNNVVDAEHGPNDLRTILGQLHAVAGSGVEAAVRVSDDDPTAHQSGARCGARYRHLVAV